MPRLTRIYTRRGDDGSTALIGGRRVGKDCLRIAAYGTVDELNSLLGVVLAAGPTAELVKPLRRIQNELLHAGAELAVPPGARKSAAGPRLGRRHVAALEKLIERLNRGLPPLKNFLLPGGSLPAAHLHLARTVCRRAERLVVHLAREEPVSSHLLAYLNRLSDALFVIARYQNQTDGQAEVLWGNRA